MSLQGKADAALAASVFHFGEIKIPELKSYLCGEGITIEGVRHSYRVFLGGWII